MPDDAIFVTDDATFVTDDAQFGSPDGYTWGEETPSPEEAIAWSVWNIKESAGDARDTGAWGVLQLASGEEFVSDVKDLGDTDTRLLALTYDDYASGSGSGNIYWRGQATIFNQEDNEIAGPVWELYTAPANKNWRYIQRMCEGQVRQEKTHDKTK